MEADSTTYNDLNIFHQEEHFSIFNKLNFTKTAEGSQWLRTFFYHPFSEIRPITETQHIIRDILDQMHLWPTSVSNGTLMVISKFYESGIDSIPSKTDFISTMSYKIFHAPDFSLLNYSLKHVADLLRGMVQLVTLFDHPGTAPVMHKHIMRAKDLIGQETAQELASRDAGKEFSLAETIRIGRYIRYQYKTQAQELISIFGRLDAWYSMASATKYYQFAFPELSSSDKPILNAEGLYHILLPDPVPYNVDMNAASNFIFLTGANMAGKSTFIKAIGSAVFLAHLGMGVPATKMQLTVFDGLLSNINVVDNIIKGESYFFNEVQRIKNTILKINDNRKWLVLIDELFKGTNVQDAMKCSTIVIKGLSRISNSLFILSTHLYEISEELKAYPTISFRYFETEVKEDELQFSYQLKEGVSNDRIGYLILKREKVIEMLEKIR